MLVLMSRHGKAIEHAFATVDAATRRVRRTPYEVMEELGLR